MKRELQIGSAYKSSKSFYDDIMTGRTWLARLYLRFFWAVNDWEVASRVLDMIPDDFEGELLDVPVGTAVFTVEKYKRMKNAKITAVDYSADMLSQGKKRFDDFYITNINCEQGDVGNLQYADKSFDIVLSMNGFHVFPKKEKAFSETARVLKPGGMLCGCFYIKGERKRSDFLANAILAKRGWFAPPFHTKEELIAIFKRYYNTVEVGNINAISYFKCIK